jgi:tripartite-type tricarboxylate transporter receptor subunit TctC
MKGTVLAIAALHFLVAMQTPASAQEWPRQNIRLIVSFGAGGGTDIVARVLAEAMQGRLGNSVIVENKPGAGGTLGDQMVAHAAADGYTIGMMTAGQLIAAVTRRNLPYDATALTPMAQIGVATLIIAARPNFSARDVNELVTMARANPGKVVLASPGFIATQHFAGELFQQTARVSLLQVPFRTTPEAINAVVGNHADVLFDTVSALIGPVQSGNLKALAVTSKDRFPPVPSVPAAAESGVLPGYDVSTWYGVVGPPGVPAEVVGKLNRTLNDVIAEPSMRARLFDMGVITRGSTPEAFGKFIADEYKRWNTVREAAGIPRQ